MAVQQIGSAWDFVDSPARYEVYGKTPEQARARSKRSQWRDRYWFRQVATGADDTLPVTVAQVRDRLRLNDDEPEADIQLMIKAAVKWWQGETDTVLLPQTWRMVWDWFPDGGSMIPIFISPVRSVESVVHLDKAGEDETLADTGWTALIDSYDAAAVARIGNNRDWPRRPFTNYRPDGVKITVECGYADVASIPADITDALILWVGMRYRFREAVTEMDIRVLPWGLRSVVNRYTADLGDRSMTLGS